ncbi:MAG: LysM peptidoglycan-binding domain-containing protein [bacterium]|nr:LysM peptidoglycan-binding domain-containing protein [bacterium]
MIKSKFFMLILLILLASLLVACGANEDSTPTAPAVVQEPINPLPQVTDVTPTLTVTSSATVQPSPQPTSTEPPITPTQTETSLPSETPIPTATEGPWVYTIKEGDSLITIIQQEPFNYRTQDVFREIVRLNNLISADILPPAGQTILIPRPTITPTPQNDIGVTTNNTSGATMPPMRPNVNLAPWEQVGQYTIQLGDSLVSIAEQFSISLGQISQLNADISFIGCNFDLPAGGPNCNPFIREGQVINVLVPTATMTLTPTPSGLETATMTPTFNAPMQVSPPNGGIAAGLVTLQWVTVGVLRPEEQYLIQVVDNTSGTTWTGITKQTTLRLPEELIPNDGQQHLITWTISVAQVNSDNSYNLVGVLGEARSFTWNSR